MCILLSQTKVSEKDARVDTHVHAHTRDGRLKAGRWAFVLKRGLPFDAAAWRAIPMLCCHLGQLDGFTTEFWKPRSTAAGSRPGTVRFPWVWELRTSIRWRNTFSHFKITRFAYDLRVTLRMNFKDSVFLSLVLERRQRKKKKLCWRCVTLCTGRRSAPSGVTVAEALCSQFSLVWASIPNPRDDSPQFQRTSGASVDCPVKSRRLVEAVCKCKASEWPRRGSVFSVFFLTFSKGAGEILRIKIWKLKTDLLLTVLGFWYVVCTLFLFVFPQFIPG